MEDDKRATDREPERNDVSKHEQEEEGSGCEDLSPEEAEEPKRGLGRSAGGIGGGGW